MSMLWCNAAAWAVALLYCIWKTSHLLARRRELVLRQRVAYLLWNLAERLEDLDPSGLTPRSF